MLGSLRNNLTIFSGLMIKKVNVLRELIFKLYAYRRIWTNGWFCTAGEPENKHGCPAADRPRIKGWGLGRLGQALSSGLPKYKGCRE
jgi:hypothetical protein